MIADGLGEEVTGFLRLHLKHNLGAAEIILVLVVQEFSLCGKETVQFARYLENCHGALRDLSVDAYPDAGFKVGVVLPVADHIERNRAVGKEDFTCLHINPGRIRLEAGKTGQGL